MKKNLPYRHYYERYDLLSSSCTHRKQIPNLTYGLLTRGTQLKTVERKTFVQVLNFWIDMLNDMAAQDEIVVFINWLSVVYFLTQYTSNILCYLHVYVSLEDGISEGVNDGLQYKKG